MNWTTWKRKVNSLEDFNKLNKTRRLMVIKECCNYSYEECSKSYNRCPVANGTDTCEFFKTTVLKSFIIFNK